MYDIIFIERKGRKIITMEKATNLMELDKNYNLNLSEDICERSNRDYNCMGFAIGTYEWEGLSSFEYTYEDEVESYEEIKAQRDEVCYRCALEMTLMYLHGNYPRMRILNDKDEIKPDETLIAMKIGEDDFHFMRRFPDGKWYEKCGGSVLRECTDVVEDEEWESIYGSHYYDSDTIYLAL
jgi:hypothetical protein